MAQSGRAACDGIEGHDEEHAEIRFDHNDDLEMLRVDGGLGHSVQDCFARLLLGCHRYPHDASLGASGQQQN